MMKLFSAALLNLVVAAPGAKPHTPRRARVCRAQGVLYSITIRVVPLIVFMGGHLVGIFSPPL